MQGDTIAFPVFSYEGHRGARGLYPENSIGAMKTAIDLPKVTTLEMDCHITKDKKVVVYHDDSLNPKFVQYKNGEPLAGKDIKGIIYSYTYHELGAFDIGSKPYSDFPEQKKIKTSINLLSDLIDEAEAYAREKRKKPMFYNIETKSSPTKDHTYHPGPEEFSDLVLQIVVDKGIASRTVIQSFDKRTIQYINKVYPQIRTSYLIDAKNTKSVKDLVEELGFTPFIISPNFRLVTPDFLTQAKQRGIKIIPWTVNDKNEIKRLTSMGVDGIISDYPNLF
ncbi:glycerophosphoryl diester phosphodiesterase [Sphingobacterium allocomposti]|uniref:Glycerophosphoryl diester phosphodiesterase n=1 Tax=Sphingobacterium allocomposti TaxID=415956 RepID=A0A5S5DM22_9SPHI|nr:glycerophosphodiester phosphodiesterase family protein [Sphingobacterium composti Yoo et al. 2007 non Ten et al. 2007]TYP96891.1 glycerophosphoryl diester phosphodiesterase [Sphingobacterium composti Yoo et al. 2007 non Ten et al. 2007]